MAKVIVGMSGGIDSSVTAYILKEQGYDVEGVSFILWDERNLNNPNIRCCSAAIRAASENAAHLKIPHTIIDVQKVFREKVINPFINLYLKGLTPNPCILCNRFIKFPMLFEVAREKAANYVATGHYARIESVRNNKQREECMDKSEDLCDYFLLKKGIDEKKDQSYVLYTLGQRQLKRLITPLGYYNKKTVRMLASDIKLPVTRSESQEICFIEDRKYPKFIEKLSNFTARPGPIVNIENNEILGEHKGIHRYTIGQRKGLGISFKEPLYVIAIDALKNILYVGSQEAAKKRELWVEEVNWIIPAWSRRGVRPYNTCRVSVKVRSTMKDEIATLYLVTPHESQVADKKHDNNGTRTMHYEPFELVRVVFDEPQWAPAPGQSAVFYNGDIVIGGGVIKKSI